MVLWFYPSGPHSPFTPHPSPFQLLLRPLPHLLLHPPRARLIWLLLCSSVLSWICLPMWAHYFYSLLMSNARLPVWARYLYSLIYCHVFPSLCVPAIFIACSIVLRLPAHVRPYFYSLLYCPVLPSLFGPAIFKACFIVLCVPASVGPLFNSLLYCLVLPTLCGPATL